MRRGRIYHYFALEDCVDGTVETLFNISTDFRITNFKSCFLKKFDFYKKIDYNIYVIKIRKNKK